MSMADVLARFESWLQEHAPDYMESLAPGLAEARIDEIGAKLGFELPEPVRTLYRWRDGDPEEDGRLLFSRIFMPLESAIEQHRMLTEMLEVGEWADDSGRQAPSIWSPEWFPVFTWDNGFHLCVDMGGAYGGRPGQVVEVWLKDEDRSIVAPDLTSWLDAQVSSLEAGLWRFEEDHEQWEPADEGAYRAFFAERLPGYPIERSADELP
jgi:cell wall assembly regulator SMI1